MRKLTVLLGAIFGVAAVSMAVIIFKPAPEGPNDVNAHNSAAQHFVVKFTPENPDFRRNALHAWIVEVKTAGGDPVANATITIDGGMPMHGHGLPTRPQLTEKLGGGRYKIDGMQFHMAGQWQLDLEITADDVTDTVTFDLVF